MKKVLIILSLFIFLFALSTGLSAEKKKIAKVQIEISFNKNYLSYKGGSYTIYFMENKTCFFVDKNAQVSAGSYDINGSKIIVKTKEKTISFYLIDNNKIEYEGESLMIEK